MMSVPERHIDNTLYVLDKEILLFTNSNTDDSIAYSVGDDMNYDDVIDGVDDMRYDDYDDYDDYDAYDAYDAYDNHDAYEDYEELNDAWLDEMYEEDTKAKFSKHARGGFDW